MKNRFTIRHIALLTIVGVIALLLIVLRFAPQRQIGGTPTDIGTTVEVPAEIASSSPSATAVAGRAGTPAAASSSTGRSAPADDDDGVGGDPAPALVPTDQPDVKEAATQFAAAWLNAHGQDENTWRTNLNGRITEELAAALADADPDTVPAGARAGTVTVTAQGSLLGADAPIVTADAKRTPLGTLHLTLVQRNHTWLVSEIDWDPIR